MNIGDHVTWTRTKRNSSGFSMTTKEGQITGFNEPFANIKFRNGRKTMVNISRLRLKGEQSELTESVLSMGKK